MMTEEKGLGDPCFLLWLLSHKIRRTGFPSGRYHKTDDILATEAVTECLTRGAPSLIAGRTTDLL